MSVRKMPDSASASQSPPSTTGHKRLLWILVTLCPIIGAALFINHLSERWVPDAEKKVKDTSKKVVADALATLEKSSKDHPSDVGIQLAYAHALLDRKAYFPALLPAERAARLDHANVEPQLLLATVYAELGYREKALNCYGDLLKASPKNLEVMQKLADYLAATNDVDRARQVLELAHATAPDASGPRMSLASLYTEQGKNPDALSILEPILTDLDKAPVGALYLASKACQAMGRQDRAEKMLRTAIRRAPDFADAYHALGSLCCNQSNQKEGIPLLEKSVELAPQSFANRYALGSAWFGNLNSSERLANSKAAFEAALDLDPQSDWAHYYYGLTLEQLDEKDAALREYDRVIEINSRFDSALYRKAAVLTALGRAAEAKQYYDQFDKDSKQEITNVHGNRRKNSILDTAAEHYRRGMSLVRKGDNAGARADFQLSLQRDPNFGPAKRALDGLGGR